MELSVIIPCFNAVEVIGEQLDAFAAERWDGEWELIVADNGSTDASLDLIQSYAGRIPNLKVIVASDRRGQAHAKNEAVAVARGCSIAFSDADDVIGPGWVKAMGEALRRHQFVACRIDLEKLNEPWIRHARGAPQRDGIVPYRYPKYLPHAGGGTLGIRRQLLLNVGGFDESLPRLEDCDFCWRVELHGVELNFVPDAVLHVRCRSTLAKMWKQAMVWGEYNVLIYKRYLPFGMPRLTLREMTDGWASLFQYAWRHRYSLREKGPLAGLLWHLGWRVGRVRGSVKHRVFAL
jgi:GT2 family glycosyltransferase